MAASGAVSSGGAAMMAYVGQTRSLVRLLLERTPALPVQLVVPSARQLLAKARSFVDHAARALATLGVICALPARSDHRGGS